MVLCAQIGRPPPTKNPGSLAGETGVRIDQAGRQDRVHYYPKSSVLS